ncbi:MAG: 7-cyano-7-deazaguanine synthase, partial [Kiritimatiellae bacterium]|nr:7-cyano-7-deazaguanine synthase [Kiritimatiellia bacterium]
MKREKALVVFSGGQDSTTCLAQALLDYGAGNVACITFHYGQRHGREVDVARRVAEHFGVAGHKFISLDWYSQVTESALLDPQVEIGKDADAACPNTVVDGRNML